MSTVNGTLPSSSTRPSKIQIEVKDVTKPAIARNTATPLNVDSDGGD
ncbi:MAG: hypothetical protein HC835_16215 [Oscillatoriales cyanobacterium RM2_1_1]|nr:hypothetical protein [Oscillatoriales cyanobacterium SM2_3_0]NJO47035.1 hypothetical protein [Oscillatoriales cyanobacterium RM2_1_1]